MTMNQWAIKWGIPFEAVEDLRREFGLVSTDPSPISGESEAAVQTRIRLEASRKGCRLWRNNVGGTYTQDGGFLRYGLANDSKQMNDTIKSSDLVGIRPVTIANDHVGRVLGQFVCREVKAADWRYSGTKRELAQLKFLELVMSLGGDAAFANGEGSL
jgi:hypothetical protein